MRSSQRARRGKGVGGGLYRSLAMMHSLAHVFRLHLHTSKGRKGELQRDTNPHFVMPSLSVCACVRESVSACVRGRECPVNAKRGGALRARVSRANARKGDTMVQPRSRSCALTC
jgi:hypothetical protein